MKTLTQIEAEFDKEFELKATPHHKKDELAAFLLTKEANLWWSEIMREPVKEFYRQAFTELLEGLKLEKKQIIPQGFERRFYDSLNTIFQLEGFNQAIDQYESLKKELLK